MEGGNGVFETMRDLLFVVIRIIYLVCVLLIDCRKHWGWPDLYSLGLFWSMITDRGSLRRAREKYDGSNYMLCDAYASGCWKLFQEFAFDLPESLEAHFQMRYLATCSMPMSKMDALLSSEE